MIKIIVTAFINTKITSITNIIHGFFYMDEPIYFPLDKYIHSKMIVKTYDTNIEQMEQMYKQYNLFFIGCETNRKYIKKYYSKKNFISIKTLDLNLNSKDGIEEVYHLVKKILPDDLFTQDKNTMIHNAYLRIKSMNDEKNKIFYHIDNHETKKNTILFIIYNTSPMHKYICNILFSILLKEFSLQKTVFTEKKSNILIIHKDDLQDWIKNNSIHNINVMHCEKESFTMNYEIMIKNHEDIFSPLLKQISYMKYHYNPIIPYARYDSRIKLDNIDLILCSMYNSGEYEMISYFEQNNYNVKSISYKDCLLHYPIVLKTNIPVVYCYRNIKKAFTQCELSPNYKDYIKNTCNNYNVSSCDKYTLLLAMVKQFENITQTKNVFFLKTDSFNESTHNSLCIYLNKKLSPFPTLNLSNVIKPFSYFSKLSKELDYINDFSIDINYTEFIDYNDVDLNKTTIANAKYLLLIKNFEKVLKSNDVDLIKDAIYEADSENVLDKKYIKLGNKLLTELAEKDFMKEISKNNINSIMNAIEKAEINENISEHLIIQAKKNLQHLIQVNLNNAMNSNNTEALEMAIELAEKNEQTIIQNTNNTLLNEKQLANAKEKILIENFKKDMLSKNISIIESSINNAKHEGIIPTKYIEKGFEILNKLHNEQFIMILRSNNIHNIKTALIESKEKQNVRPDLLKKAEHILSNHLINSINNSIKTTNLNEINNLLENHKDSDPVKNAKKQLQNELFKKIIQSGDISKIKRIIENQDDVDVFILNNAKHTLQKKLTLLLEKGIKESNINTLKYILDNKDYLQEAIIEKANNIYNILLKSHLNIIFKTNKIIEIPHNKSFIHSTHSNTINIIQYIKNILKTNNIKTILTLLTNDDIPEIFTEKIKYLLTQLSTYEFNKQASINDINRLNLLLESVLNNEYVEQDAINNIKKKIENLTIKENNMSNKPVRVKKPNIMFKLF